MAVTAVAEHLCCLISKICPVFPSLEKNQKVFVCSVLQRAQSEVFYTTPLKSSVPLATSISISQEERGEATFLKDMASSFIDTWRKQGQVEIKTKSKIAHFPGLCVLSVSCASEPIMKYLHVLNTRKFKQRLVALFCDLSL